MQTTLNLAEVGIGDPSQRRHLTQRQLSELSLRPNERSQLSLPRVSHLVVIACPHHGYIIPRLLRPSTTEGRYRRRSLRQPPRHFSRT